MNGECCKKTFKFKVGVEECNPCELLKNFQVIQTNLGAITRFESSVPHQTGMIYHWKFFNDDLEYHIREVERTTQNQKGILTISYVGNDQRNCCKGRQSFKLVIEQAEINSVTK